MFISCCLSNKCNELNTMKLDGTSKINLRLAINETSKIQPTSRTDFQILVLQIGDTTLLAILLLSIGPFGRIYKLTYFSSLFEFCWRQILWWQLLFYTIWNSILTTYSARWKLSCNSTLHTCIIILLKQYLFCFKMFSCLFPF